MLFFGCKKNKEKENDKNKKLTKRERKWNEFEEEYEELLDMEELGFFDDDD